MSAPVPLLWQTARVSFDVFFQGFVADDSSQHGGAAMREVLAPHIIEETESFLRVRVGDGEAEVYLRDDEMMANHISGRETWDLLFRGAQAADWVIMPLDCPTCLTQAGQRAELPAELRDDAVLVDTVVDLRAVIESR